MLDEWNGRDRGGVGTPGKRCQFKSTQRKIKSQKATKGRMENVIVKRENSSVRRRNRTLPPNFALKTAGERGLRAELKEIRKRSGESKGEEASYSG